MNTRNTSGSHLTSDSKAANTKGPYEENTSVEMKLAIVLFGISLVLANQEQYEGFNNCGVDGWSCLREKGQFQIIYTCRQGKLNARVWVWTARLPTGTSIFTVRDCNHLEVHFDCTKGLRATPLRQFRVINVTTLEILPPLLPQVFLHDNDQFPHVPPEFYVSNVKKIKWYPGVFDKPGGACRYKFLELSSLTFENVHIDRMMKDLLQNQLMNTFVMKNVVIDAIDSNALNIGANTTITGSTFPVIPGNGISLRGQNITFINNTFKKVQTNGVTIKSREFEFSSNHVEEVSAKGLKVLGASIEITKNVFNHLETGAFQSITPGYSPLTYEIASRFIYNFSHNFIRNINPGSIHLNWEVYKKVCSDIIFENNTFECSCVNLGWLSVSNGLGPTITKSKEFYDIYLSKGDNFCSEHDRCPLNAVLAQIQDVCNKKTNISAICSSLSTATNAVSAESSHDFTTPLPTQDVSEGEIFVTDRIEATEKIIPILSYTENQTSHMETTGLPVWFIVIPVIILLAAMSLGIFMWWYKKKKQRQMIMTVYKNERGADTDNLLVINEQHNELFNKQ